jgi:hypothetical protein
MEPEKKKQKVVDMNTKLAIVKHLDEGHNIKATADKFNISKVSQPYFGQVWGCSPTLGKSEDLESSGTLECSELDSKAQNTSH